MEHALVLGIIVIALVLFITEIIRADLVAIAVMLILFFSGIIDVNEAFSGFSNPATITVIAMFILSAGLVNTGVADLIGRGILHFCGPRPALLTAASMLTVGVMSAFMNNIGAVAVMIPAMVGIAEKTGYPLSRLLMPLSFGSLLGGLLTVIGTPPNLLVSMALEDAGFEGFALFDFAPTGIVVLTVGVLYMVFIGRHLIPAREVSNDLTRQFHLDEYLTEILIPKDSPYVGKNMRDAGIRENLGLSVLRMRRKRGGRVFNYVPGPESRLEEGDRLIAQGDLTELLKEKEAGRLEIYAERKFTEKDLSGEGVELAEIVVSPGSSLVGSSIRDFDARRVLSVLVLALKRGGESINRDFSGIPLEAGDVLLVQGRPGTLAELSGNPDFLVVSKVNTPKRSYRRAPIALGIMAVAVLVAAFGVVHISIAAMAGAFVMTVARCVKVEDIYTAVDWRVVFLIAGMIPLGIAMDDNHSGTARWLAEGMIGITGDASPLVMLAILFLFTTLITEVMSNAAAAVLLAPITIAIATGMGLEPYPFLMAVAIGASTTFLTPIGHQSNVLVYGIGNYRFMDFARAGGLLNVLLFGTVLVIVPMVWPFRPL